MIYIGIDPGNDGGIGVINTISERTEAIPYSDDALIRELFQVGRQRVIVEEVHSMPKQGVKSTFAFGVNYGRILGILKALKVSYETVSPRVWKKEFGCTSDKKTSIDVCHSLFPLVDLKRTEKCKKDHDGMAEAMLLAEYARRHMK